ncbi:MAG: SpoIIE family protein phosphatase [Phycisphaerae bacterium]
MTNPLACFAPEQILSSISDGVYVTDRDRRIVYWGRGAERITGYSEEDVLGRRCCDDVLGHATRDGRSMCGRDSCPLHRSMMLGEPSSAPVVLFAKGKAGERIPMTVSVAPIRDEDGEVVGGVEIFRDSTEHLRDLHQARTIQEMILRDELEVDSRVRFRTHYSPFDVVGGDYYALTRLDADRYAIMLADVTGHGISAALCTMLLRSLWEQCRSLLDAPAKFAAEVGHRLHMLVNEQDYFASASVGVLNVSEPSLTLTSAGNPHPLLVRGGQYQRIETSGLPLGALKRHEYTQMRLELHHGDRLLLFTDGATDVRNGKGVLGWDGFAELLRAMDYPIRPLELTRLEEAMLRYSDRLRLEDDLTLLEIHLPESA